MDLFLVFNLILSIWKTMCWQLFDKGKAVGLLIFIDMKPPNGLLVFLMERIGKEMERKGKFLAIPLQSAILGSLR